MCTEKFDVICKLNANALQQYIMAPKRKQVKASTLKVNAKAVLKEVSPKKGPKPKPSDTARAKKQKLQVEKQSMEAELCLGAMIKENTYLKLA